MSIAKKAKDIRFEKEATALKRNLEKRKKQEKELLERKKKQKLNEQQS